MDNIFKEFLVPDPQKYERYNASTDTLTISTNEYELTVTSENIILDKVQFNNSVLNPAFGIPLYRENVMRIEYVIFMNSNSDEVFGVTKNDVIEVLNYFEALK